MGTGNTTYSYEAVPFFTSTAAVMAWGRITSEHTAGEIANRRSILANFDEIIIFKFLLLSKPVDQFNILFI